VIAWYETRTNLRRGSEAPRSTAYGGHCAHEEYPEVVYKIVGALLAETARLR
jgi:hypothetical protein